VCHRRLHQHVSRVSQTCFFHLRRIRSVRRQLGRDVTAKLVTTLVLSRLDHCNTVLAGLPATTLAPLQRILHAAARTVLDLKLGDHVTPALKELHWLPITERIQYKLCLLSHKMFVGNALDYIASLLTPASDIPSRSSLRSSSNCDLVVPRTSLKTGDRALSVAAPRAWNRLPTDLKLLRSTTSFKSKLESFLFHAAYTGNTHYVNSGMRYRSDCKGCTTSHCCYCHFSDPSPTFTLYIKMWGAVIQ